MTIQVSVFIATSLDGYIARENDDLDWLDEANSKVPEGEDCGYASFIEDVDVLVMGRKTYEMVLSFGVWPYEDIAVVVLSRNKITFPEDFEYNLSCSSESPVELCKRLESEGAKHLYIDGGQTIQGFLKEGLVTDITITLIPIVLGSGKSLFGRLEDDIPFNLVSSKAFDFGFVQLSYEVERSH